MRNYRIICSSRLYFAGILFLVIFGGNAFLAAVFLALHIKSLVIVLLSLIIGASSFYFMPKYSKAEVMIMMDESAITITHVTNLMFRKEEIRVIEWSNIREYNDRLIRAFFVLRLFLVSDEKYTLTHHSTYKPTDDFESFYKDFEMIAATKGINKNKTFIL